MDDDFGRPANCASYQGRATFGQLTPVDDLDQLEIHRAHAAIVGAPWDGNTANRPGARFGPRALRASAYGPGTYHLDLQVEIFDYLKAVDAGDAQTLHGLWDPSRAAIEDKVWQVARRSVIPIVLGGDHSITWPSATAVARHHGFGKIGIIHFDAHADTANDVEGNLASHGTPMRRLIESGAVLGRNFVQVGLRGYWPPADVIEWMREQRMRTHFMQEIWERGIRDVMDDVIAEALDGTDGIYLSVDIDVLDPGFAPGTGTPEPGGMSPADLLRAVRRIALETNLVAVDVVEVAPAYDHADVTVNNAHTAWCGRCSEPSRPSSGPRRRRQPRNSRLSEFASPVIQPSVDPPASADQRLVEAGLHVDFAPRVSAMSARLRPVSDGGFIEV